MVLQSEFQYKMHQPKDTVEVRPTIEASDRHRQLYKKPVTTITSLAMTKQKLWDKQQIFKYL